MRLSPLLACALALATLGPGCISSGPSDGEDAPGATPPPGEDSGGASCTPVEPESVNEGVDAGSMATVSNQPGAFSYSRQGVVAAATRGHPWENPAGTATFSGSLQGAGSVTLHVYDACGGLIMEKTLTSGSQTSSETLPAGEAGQWVVQLDFDAFSGTVTFSLTS